MKKLNQILREGVYDPGIFKAFFLAGGPGSGKSFVTAGAFGGTGLKTVNSDAAFERGLKKGGKADKNWIQGVNKSIKERGTKGVCTGKKFGSASCKPGSKRYNLAKTFKKMARARHASGGLVRFI